MDEEDEARNADHQAAAGLNRIFRPVRREAMAQAGGRFPAHKTRGSNQQQKVEKEKKVMMWGRQTVEACTLQLNMACFLGSRLICCTKKGSFRD